MASLYSEVARPDTSEGEKVFFLNIVTIALILIVIIIGVSEPGVS